MVTKSERELAFSPVRSMLRHIENISRVRAGAIRCLVSGLFSKDHYESSRRVELAMLASARDYLESAREFEIRKGCYGAASQARYFEAHGLLCDLVNGLELEIRLESAMVQLHLPVYHSTEVRA